MTKETLSLNGISLRDIIAEAISDACISNGKGAYDVDLHAATDAVLAAIARAGYALDLMDGDGSKRHLNGRPAVPGKPLELQTRDELLAYIRGREMDIDAMMDEMRRWENDGWVHLDDIEDVLTEKPITLKKG